MSEKNKQDISNLNNSTAIQAGGNVYYGLNYTEVKDLIQTTTAAEIGKLTLEAKKEFEKQLEDLERRLCDKFEKIENKTIIEKLRKPGIQLCVHDTIMASMRTDDELTKDQLLEMLIDRLDTDENDTRKAIIEDAIGLTAKVSKPLLTLMVALQFRTYYIAAPFRAALDQIFMQMGELFKELDNLSSLDLAYGNQLRCITDIPAGSLLRSYEEHLLSNYDLHFRHNINHSQYQRFHELHPEIGHAIKYADIERVSIICIDGQTENIDDNDREVSLIAPSTQYLCTQLNEQGKDYLIPALDMLIERMPLFNKEELRERLINLNIGWKSLFNAFSKPQVNNVILTPVG